VTEVHSIAAPAASKPAKPSPDFPLFPHATKRWAKKISGKLVYFGPWAEPWAALRAYEQFVAGNPKAERPAASDTSGRRPAKPRGDFPLFAHASGQWAKKIRGRMFYFGKWDDPEAAEAKYNAEQADLYTGRTPRVSAGELTVAMLAKKFLTTKERLRDAGELSPRSYDDYEATCERISKSFGKTRLVSDLRPEDFEALRTALAVPYGPVRLGNEINRVRIVFNYAAKNGLLERPIVFGEGFKRPSKKVLRGHKQSQGLKMFESGEIRRLLKAAGPSLKAMILLGVNCGFGNSDCGTLPLPAVDLAGGWINYPRPKTGVSRRCPLWPETVASLMAWRAVRPEPKDAADAKLAFLTRQGNSWHTDSPANPLSAEMRKLLDSLGINGSRNFYALRHTFQTIGDESGDFLAVRSIMGHADSDISAHYRERVSDERLKKVAEHVRGWLFSGAEADA
jgi:integrase